MTKKVFLSFGIIILLISVWSFKNSPLVEGESKVHWYTFEEAVEAQKKNNKIIMVDVYTSWCGPCKAMSKYTFGDSVIAKYLNEHFLPVKFNAETRDTVQFNGFIFVNKNPPEARRPVHEFAKSILENKLLYPSIVFLNKDIQRLQIVKGYYTAKKFEPIINYFGSGKYKDTNYEDYILKFVGEVK